MPGLHLVCPGCGGDSDHGWALASCAGAAPHAGGPGGDLSKEMLRGGCVPGSSLAQVPVSSPLASSSPHGCDFTCQSAPRVPPVGAGCSQQLSHTSRLLYLNAGLSAPGAAARLWKHPLSSNCTSFSVEVCRLFFYHYFLIFYFHWRFPFKLCPADPRGPLLRSRCRVETWHYSRGSAEVSSRISVQFVAQLGHQPCVCDAESPQQLGGFHPAACGSISA